MLAFLKNQQQPSVSGLRASFHVQMVVLQMKQTGHDLCPERHLGVRLSQD
jgi:hypothetical protein